MYWPEPFTVKAPFAYVALPARPTLPTSWSSQPCGNVDDVTVKPTALLSFMVGATETTMGPEVAPTGIVTAIDVALQVFTVTTPPFRYTALFPCVLPNPLPVIATGVPTGPPVAERLVITGAGAAAELTETLSNVAVASAELFPLVTASPMYTFGAMLIVWLVPICTQFTPSEET